VLQKKNRHAVYIVQWIRIPFINVSGYNAIKYLINVRFQKVNVLSSSSFIINRKFRKRWSTIPPISTKLTITSHLNSLNIKIPRHMTLEIQDLTWDRHKNVVGLNQFIHDVKYRQNNLHICWYQYVDHDEISL